MCLFAYVYAYVKKRKKNYNCTCVSSLLHKLLEFIHMADCYARWHFFSPLLTCAPCPSLFCKINSYSLYSTSSGEYYAYSPLICSVNILFLIYAQVISGGARARDYQKWGSEPTCEWYLEYMVHTYRGNCNECAWILAIFSSIYSHGILISHIYIFLHRYMCVHTIPNAY